MFSQTRNCVNAHREAWLQYVPTNASKINKLYETANRLLSSLKIALDILGDRHANIARELTKIHQESRLAKLSELIEYYDNSNIKGEIVLTISGKPEENISGALIEGQLRILLLGGKSAKDASNLVFNKYKGSISRKTIYQIANNLK